MRNRFIGHILMPNTDTLSVQQIAQEFGIQEQDINLFADVKNVRILFDRQYFGYMRAGEVTLPEGWMFDTNRIFYGIYFNQESIPVFITYMQIKNNEATNDSVFSVDFITPFCYGIPRKNGVIDLCNNLLRWKEDEYITSQREKWLKSNGNILLINMDVFQKGRKRCIDVQIRVDHDSIIQIKNDCRKQMLVDPKEYTRRFYDFAIKTQRAIDVGGINSFLLTNNIEMKILGTST